MACNSRRSVEWPFLASLGIQLLRLLVKRSPLLHGDEAFQSQSLFRSCDCDSPALDASIGLLARSRPLLAHDLAALALVQVGLLQAGGRLHLGASENSRLGKLPLGNHRLLHCLHSLHRNCDCDSPALDASIGLLARSGPLLA